MGRCSIKKMVEGRGKGKGKGKGKGREEWGGARSRRKESKEVREKGWKRRMARREDWGSKNKREER